MDEFLTIKEIAGRWEITLRRVLKMCAEGRIPGAKKFGRDWAIPATTEKPKDARVTIGNLPKFNPSTILLGKNETCHFMDKAALTVKQKERSYATHRSGSSYKSDLPQIRNFRK